MITYNKERFNQPCQWKGKERQGEREEEENGGGRREREGKKEEKKETSTSHGEKIFVKCLSDKGLAFSPTQFTPTTQ